MATATVRIGVWNAQWARHGSTRGSLTTAMLASLSADLLCVTEGDAAVLPDGGHVITSTADYGYSAPPWRRKVILWSRQPWTEIDVTGDPHFPSGRFVSGTTATELGPVRIAGVCIPWRDAHVRSGRRDRTPWEDHVRYVDALAGILASDEAPNVLAGDFNQRIPRTRQPRGVSDALSRCLSSYQLATADEHDGHRLIDHVAVRTPLRGELDAVLPNARNSVRLSDHIGALVEIQAAGSATAASGRLR